MDHRESISADLLERPRPTIFAAAGLVLLAVAGLWISGLTLWRFMPSDGDVGDLLQDVLYYLPFMALPIALYMRRRPGMSAAMRLNPMPVLPTLTVILLSLLTIYVANVAVGAWSMLLDSFHLQQPQTSVSLPTSRSLTLAILHAAALPAVCEELLFRGVVFSAFESRGTRLGLWGSSMLFALMHGNVYGLPAYLLVGAVSAFLVFALDSVYAGIIYHTVYNTAMLVLLYLAPQAEEAAASASQSISVASIALDAAIIGLLMLLTLRTLDLRRRARGIQAVPRTRQPLRPGEWAMLAVLMMVFVGTGILVLVGV